MENANSAWGVLYMVWGNSHDQLLERSISSLKKYHPELPVHVHRVPADTTNSASAVMFLDKASMASISPFEKTLYLDADTIVMGHLDFGFKKAEQFGLACCICECPWAQRYAGLKHSDSLVEYNTGVLFFTQKAAPLFLLWEQLVRTVDSSIRYIDHGVERVMEHNDQGAFAQAVETGGINPFVLPLNWNFRPKWYRTFYGPIRIWHDVAPPSGDIAQLNRYYENRDAIFVDVNMETPHSNAEMEVDMPQNQRDFSKLNRFLDHLALDVYPEAPSLMHSEFTKIALEHLNTLFTLHKGMKVLDVGCGQGPALEYFHSRQMDYLGITLGDEDIAACRSKGYHVEKMDQSFLDLPDNSQDLIWARHVLEHSIFPLFTLDGFRQVLKPGGILYLEVPAPETSCHHENNPNHYSVLTKNNWKSLLLRSGFKIRGDVDFTFEVPAGPDVYWGFFCLKR